MPMLAPLLAFIPEIVGAVGSGLGALGGGLAAPLLGLGTALGIPTSIAAPLSTFLSPELIGGGLGAAVGGTHGLEEGLLGGLTLGGGAGALGDLFNNAALGLGAPEGVGSALATATPIAAQLGSIAAGQAINRPSTPSVAASTITPSISGGLVGGGGGSGAAGAAAGGATKPSLYPWVLPTSGVGNVGNVGSGTPAPVASGTSTGSPAAQFLGGVPGG